MRSSANKQHATRNNDAIAAVPAKRWNRLSARRGNARSSCRPVAELARRMTPDDVCKMNSKAVGSHFTARIAAPDASSRNLSEVRHTLCFSDPSRATDRLLQKPEGDASGNVERMLAGGVAGHDLCRVAAGRAPTLSATVRSTKITPAARDPVPGEPGLFFLAPLYNRGA